MKSQNLNTKERYKVEVFNNFKEALKYEISVFKPELILAFGKPASFALSLINLPDSQKIISFPHPSGSANTEWKKVLVENEKSGYKLCSNQNKIDYLNTSIDKYFA